MSNKKFQKNWTIEEIEKLEKHYKKGRKYFKNLFPDRSFDSIYGKAFLLGLMGKTSKGFCRICGIKLTKKNTYKSTRTRYDYICKNCLLNKNRKIRMARPEYIKKYYRENILHIKGKSYVVKKRPRPESSKCELCSKEIKLLIYHHYGKVKKYKKIPGLWVCLNCHKFIELYEKGFLPIYKNLKEKILNEDTFN